MFYLLKKTEVKRFIIGGLVFIFMSACFFASILFYLYNSYISVVNSTVACIIDNVLFYYPDVDDEDLVRIINGKSVNYGSVYSILEKYGYVGGGSYGDSNYNRS